MGERRIVVLALGAVLLAACSGTPGDSGPASPSVSATPSASVLTRADLPELGPWAPHSAWAKGVYSALDDVAQFVSEYPQSGKRFAGVWPAKDGQSIGVAVVDRTYDESVAALQAWVAKHEPGVDVRPVKVTRSQEDLEALQKAVVAFVYPDGTDGTADPDAVGLAGVGTLVQTNRVMPELLPGHHDLALRIQQHFGDAVVVVEDGSIARGA
ncbi:MAG: hypothetical protein U0R68_12010 [Candidatus Nanopelagicales bacterium]